MLSGIITIGLFFLILSILVLIHEWGHYFTAKKSGVYVEEFGLGIPPRAWGKKFGETLYSINWLPFGGFVRMYGEDAEQEEEYKVNGKLIPQSRAFYSKRPLIKGIIVTAGVVMNFLLAVVIFSLLYSFTGIPEQGDRIQVGEVALDSPAAVAGIMPGDILIEVMYEQTDGTEMIVPATDVDQFIELVNQQAGQEIMIEVQRDLGQGQIETVNLTPRQNPPEGQGAMGISLGFEQISVHYPWWQMPFRGSWIGIQESFAWSHTILIMLQDMATKAVNGTVPEGVGGPIRIAAMTGEVRQYGLVYTLHFMAIISLNLAVMNLLPLPALDGGRLVFIIFEGITGRRFWPNVERYIHGVGMLALLTLLVIISIADVRALWGESILSFFRGLGIPL